MENGFLKVAALTPHIKVADPMYNANWGAYIAKEVNSDNNTLMTEDDFR